MSGDVQCPYCDVDQDICHDDGAGYSEDERHSQTCNACGKVFVFTTSISFFYEAEQADCLNGSEHDWEHTTTYPRQHTRHRCTQCDAEKALTAIEMVDFLATVPA